MTIQLDQHHDRSLQRISALFIVAMTFIFGALGLQSPMLLNNERKQTTNFSTLWTTRQNKKSQKGVKPMPRKNTIEALTERGLIAKWNDIPTVPFTPPTKTYNFSLLLAEFVESGGSLPILAELSEVSVRHLRQAVRKSCAISFSAQKRIMSAIFELYPGLSKVKIEESPPEPQRRHINRAELHRMYQDRRKEKEIYQ